MISVERIVIENIAISFTRKNIKNINLRIASPTGEVKVSAPMFTSMKRVEKFIIKRKDWILSSQKAVIERAKKNNGLVKLFGTNDLHSVKNLASLKRKYAKELIEVSKPYFEKWEKLTGLHVDCVVVHWPKTMWGSCEKSKKKIMLNGQLLAMDRKFLDYVVLHELTHLKYSNHGANFKEYMTKYMPDWRDVKKELNGK